MLTDRVTIYVPSTTDGNEEEETMREKLNKSEIQSLNSVMDRVDKLYKHFEDKDVVLHYGNHSVATQLSCALASLETILQEF